MLEYSIKLLYPFERVKGGFLSMTVLKTNGEKITCTGIDFDYVCNHKFFFLYCDNQFSKKTLIAMVRDDCVSKIIG